MATRVDSEVLVIGDVIVVALPNPTISVAPDVKGIGLVERLVNA